IRHVLAEIIDGVRSAPEAELRTLLRCSRRLPPIEWNPVLVAEDGTRLPTPDGFIAAVGLALEVDSREHHADDEHWQRTMHRQNIYSQNGILVLRFTPTQIRTQATSVRRIVERTYAELRREQRVSTDAGLNKFR